VSEISERFEDCGIRAVLLLSYLVEVHLSELPLILLFNLMVFVYFFFVVTLNLIDPLALQGFS
jgi:hypothetical protein